jgi:hypothetical protein
VGKESGASDSGVGKMVIKEFIASKCSIAFVGVGYSSERGKPENFFLVAGSELPINF